MSTVPSSDNPAKRPVKRQEELINYATTGHGPGRCQARDEIRTFGFRIREHGRRARHAGLHSPPSPNRTRSSTDVPPYGDVASHRECLHSLCRIQHHHEICNISPNLEPPTQTSCADARGCGPRTIRKSSDDETRTSFPREDKACLENLEDGES
jgi:hypothetical protein